MYLTVTIDTEEDNWGEYQRLSYSVENIARIPRLHEMFSYHGVRPTYLITYPVATSPAAINILAKYRADAQCEIGSHPHPWNTPPVEEERTPFNSYISHLPPGLQYQKIHTLHSAIEKNFGVSPTSYRSGRWAFSDDVARNLVRLGYAVDTSVSPVSDWRQYDGPNYSDCSLEPFVYRIERSADEAGGSLLEIPATIEFVQNWRALANSAYWTISRSVPQGNKILAVLSKLRVLNHVCLSPETHDASQMIRLARRLQERGTKVINMFFHSPSLLENCSPFVKTPGEVASFVARIEKFLLFAKSAGMRFVTLSELRPVDVGASRVRLLDDRGARNSCGPVTKW